MTGMPTKSSWPLTATAMGQSQKVWERGELWYCRGEVEHRQVHCSNRLPGMALIDKRQRVSLSRLLQGSRHAMRRVEAKAVVAWVMLVRAWGELERARWTNCRCRVALSAEMCNVRCWVMDRTVRLLEEGMSAGRLIPRGQVQARLCSEGGVGVTGGGSS